MTLKDALGYARKYWYLVPVAVMGFLLVNTRERLAKSETTLYAERAAWKESNKIADAQKALDEKRYLQTRNDASAAYASRETARDPVIVRATNTVREYEKTDASRVQCLDADWVQRLKDNRQALFPQDTGSPSKSSDTVSSQYTAPAG